MGVLPGKPRVFGYLVAAALIVGPRVAEAKRYKVRITSKPSGATVLLGNGKELGKTPLTTRIKSGEHVIVLRKRGYIETVETIEVDRRHRRFRYSLERAEMGEVRVISKKRDVLNGAAIFVDGKEVGTVPDTISVEAGTRQIEVKKEGFANFDEWVEVEPDGAVVVKAFARATESASDDTSGDDVEADDLEGDDLEGGDSDDLEGGSGTQVAVVGVNTETAPITKKASRPGRPRGSVLVLRLGVDFGGRVFKYSNPQTQNLRPYSAFGIPIGRAEAELYPLGFMSNAIARGLGITGSFGFGAPLKSEADVNGTPTSVDTAWRDWSVGGRFRVAPSPTLSLAFGGAYGKMSFNFKDEGGDLEGEVPDVDYNQTTLSLDIETKATESVTVVLGGRFILLSGFGELGERFRIESSLGLGGLARVDVALTDRFDLVLRFAYQIASLTLEMSDPAFMADGGTDQILGGMLGLGVNL